MSSTIKKNYKKGIRHQRKYSGEMGSVVAKKDALSEFGKTNGGINQSIFFSLVNIKLRTILLII